MKKQFWMKRLTALLLAAAVIFGTLPGELWTAAAADVVEIATAEESAAMEEFASAGEFAVTDSDSSDQPASSLNGEEEKYHSVRVSADAEAGSAVSLLKDGEAAAGNVTVAYEVEENDYVAGGGTVTLKKQNDTFATVSIPVTVKLTDSEGNAAQKRVNVVLPVASGMQTDIMDQIASALTESSDSWTVMDMKAYGTLEGKTAATSEGALQNALNFMISGAAGSNVSVSDRSRIEIVLRSMGVDTTKLYAVNSNKALDNAASLREADLTSGGHYAAPWILLADLQGNVKLPDTQKNTLISLLKANVGGGLFSYEYGGVTYSDPDTAGVALAALARFYDSSADAKYVVDQILAALPGLLDEKGSLGNANSDAVVITGLLAMGKDPKDYAADSGASLTDGLLSYVNDRGNAFLYQNWSTGEMEENALATEQAFRALVALAKASGTDGAGADLGSAGTVSAFNIYDFSKTQVQPGRATGEGEVEPPPSEPSGGSSINVTITIRADRDEWLEKTTIEVKKGATIYHAFTKALAGKPGMSAVGAESGYVKSITKDGVTLAEFDKGVNSGWLYNVNGETPNVSMTRYVLENGDDIVWFYSADYQKDPNVSRGSSAVIAATAADVIKLIDAIGTVDEKSGDKIKAAREAYDKLSKTEQAKVTNYQKLVAAEKAYADLSGAADENGFTDVQGHWAADAIRFVVNEKLFAGTTATTFEPETVMSRGMLVTVLWHLDGSPKTDKGGAGSEENAAQSTAEPFADVKSDAYYAEAVAWARDNEIVKGYSETSFAPDDKVTREQIATILRHYAEYKGYDVSGAADLSAFADRGSISAYAADAMKWAHAAGLINGRSQTRLAPQGEATRAEVAAILQHFVTNVKK